MRISQLSFVLILIPGFSASIVQANARPVASTASNVPVLMVSDIHFDPCTTRRNSKRSSPLLNHNGPRSSPLRPRRTSRMPPQA